jgi:hypothetical protein
MQPPIPSRPPLTREEAEAILLRLKMPDSASYAAVYEVWQLRKHAERKCQGTFPKERIDY